MSGDAVVPRPGDLLLLTEEQYRYGLGPVLVRLREIIAPVEYDGQPWWHVRGDVANGTVERHGGWVDRELYVQAAALPRRGRRGAAGS